MVVGRKTLVVVFHSVEAGFLNQLKLPTPPTTQISSFSLHLTNTSPLLLATPVTSCLHTPVICTFLLIFDCLCCDSTNKPALQTDKSASCPCTKQTRKSQNKWSKLQHPRTKLMQLPSHIFSLQPCPPAVSRNIIFHCLLYLSFWGETPEIKP